MTLSQRINLSHQTPARPLDFIQNGLRFVVVANRFLAAAALIFSVAVFFYFRYYPERQMPAMDRKVMIRQHGQEVRSWGSVSDIGHFSTVRNIFEPVGSVTAQTVVDPSGRFKITGIILDRESQAVIHDQEEGKSIFVHEGDHLAGFLVKKIQTGKVIVSLEDREWELKP